MQCSTLNSLCEIPLRYLCLPRPNSLHKPQKIARISANFQWKGAKIKRVIITKLQTSNSMKNNALNRKILWIIRLRSDCISSKHTRLEGNDNVKQFFPHWDTPMPTTQNMPSHHENSYSAKNCSVYLILPNILLGFNWEQLCMSDYSVFPSSNGMDTLLKGY